MKIINLILVSNISQFNFAKSPRLHTEAWLHFTERETVEKVY